MLPRKIFFHNDLSPQTLGVLGSRTLARVATRGLEEALMQAMDCFRSVTSKADTAIMSGQVSARSTNEATLCACNGTEKSCAATSFGLTLHCKKKRAAKICENLLLMQELLATKKSCI